MECVFPNPASGRTGVSEGFCMGSWSWTMGHSLCACCQLLGAEKCLSFTQTSWVCTSVGLCLENFLSNFKLDSMASKGPLVLGQGNWSTGGPCAAEDLRMWSSWEINLLASIELDQLVSQGLWSRLGAMIWASVPGRQSVHGGTGGICLPVCACELEECQGER